MLDHVLHDERTPQKLAAFAWARRALLREAGRRIMAWVLTHVEPENDAEAPSRVRFAGQLSRRQGKHRSSVATLFGTVQVWRRLYEPLERGTRSIHPWERRLGIEAGRATPALAERVGYWAADHTQRQVLAMLAEDHQVQWSSTALRTGLTSLSAGMAKHRHASQVAHVVRWLIQARASQGR